MARPHPLGGAGLRWLRHAARVGRSLGATLALIGFAGAQERTGFTQEVLVLVGRLGQEEPGPVARELHARLVELEGELSNADSPDTRLALLIGNLSLADHLDSLAEPRPTRLECLQAARAVVASSTPAQYSAWADYALSVELVTTGALEQAELCLAGSLAGPAPGSPYEFPMRHLRIEVLRKLTRWEEALEALADFEAALAQLESLASREAAGLLLWRARLHGSRGLIEQGLGRLDMALREHRLEGRFAERSGDLLAQAAHRLNRCDLALLTEDYRFVEESLSNLHEQPLYAVLAPERVAQFGLFLGLAQSELEREEPDREKRARGTLQHVLDDESLPRSERITAERGVVDLALRRGDFEEAREHLDRILAWVESDSGGQGAEPILLATLEARWALDQGLAGPELERVGSRMQALWPALLEEWARTPVWPGGVGFLHHAERREMLSTLTRLVLARDPGRSGVETALGFLLEAQAMGTLARRSGLSAPTLAALRGEWLREDHGALVYLPSRERTHLFALDDGGAWHAELVPWDAIKGDLFEFLGLLRRGPAHIDDPVEHARRLDRLARSLSGKLLPPAIEERLRGWRSLSVLGADHLAGLPPGALRFSDGDWWGEVLALDVVPSLPVALELARRPPTDKDAATKLAVITALEPGAAAAARWPGLGTRILSEIELSGLGQAFPKETLYLADGRRETVLAADLEPLPLVHFLAHGVYLEDRERGAALVLQGDDRAPGLFTCEDVETSLRFSGAVILSACAAARGPGRPGDDSLTHLGGAFLRAGARVVVLAQAPVELDATLELMRVVHLRLSLGASPAAALRDALRDARASDDPLKPYAALQFGVLGAGQEPLF